MTIKQIIDTRQKLYAYHLPKNCVMAELGVAFGHNFFDLIYPLSKPKEAHLIDKWEYRFKRDGSPAPNSFSETKEAKLFNNVTERAKECPEVEIHNGDTVEVMNTFPDNYFDWVYVDADHTYKGCMRDLIVCDKKIKKDGYIAGHDYEIYMPEKDRRWGVKKAVDDFCVKYGYEMIYLTSSVTNSKSHHDEKTTPSYILEKKK